MKFVMRLYQEFEAENEAAAQQFIITQVKEGMKQPAAIELIQVPTKEERKAEEQLSFGDLLKNLNSSDMTKN